MSRVGKHCLLSLLVLAVIGLSFGSMADSALAKNEDVLLKERLVSLRTAAEKFAKAYKSRDYKTMYSMITPEYRRLVPLWQYKDFVEYPGVTDGHVEVQVADVSILPGNDYRYGKVMVKTITSENQKSKTTGETRTVEDEKWEFQDWLHMEGEWYRLEKIDSN